MRKIEEWGHRRWFNVIAIIASVLIIGILATYFLRYLGIITINSEVSAEGLLRAFGLVSGAIVGLYALGLAIDRQEKFSKQVQTQVDQAQVQADQSFNDRLGRGVELLAKESVVMRCAGLHVLEDLADNADVGQRGIVLNIIFDFFRDNAKINMKDGKPRTRLQEETTQDLQDALDILISLSLNDRKKLRSERRIDGRLNFSELDFSHLDFSNKTLKNIDFCHSHFDETIFGYCYINNINALGIDFVKVWFLDAKIINSRFGNGNIVSSHFISTTIEDSTLSGMEIEYTHFANFETINTAFKSVEFIGGHFWGEKKIKVSSRDGLPKFFCTEFGRTEFDFDDDVDPNHFFKLCYYGKGKRPSPKMDASREYETIGGMSVFVLPEKDSEKKPWSEQPVDEWVAVEVAKYRLERTEERLKYAINFNMEVAKYKLKRGEEGGEGGKDTAELKKDLAKAKTALDKAQERLKKQQKKKPPNPKNHRNPPNPKPPPQH